MEINNNNNEEALKNATVEAKIQFIRTVISQSEVPNDIKKIFCTNTNYDKIFYEIKDGNKNKREWVSFFNNKFFCVYCLCFSLLSENRLVKGVKYEKNCRITDKLKTHENEKHHLLAKNTFANHCANIEKQEEVYQSAKRNAIKCIVKIIIFIATHG